MIKDMNTIPRVIHYCWFGGKQLPDLAKKCIDSWKQYCPNYKIVEWNESNFDVNISQYTKEAYNEKKWAFVSDYARFWILYHFGGIYIDTDVELIKKIDDLVEAGAFMGCEPALQDMNPDKDIDGLQYLVNPGLGFGAPAGHPFLEKIIKYYDSRSFYKSSGEFDLMTVVQSTTAFLKKDGFIGSNKIEQVAEINIYPADYFCPKNYFTGELCITENTRSIHHYTASWQNDGEKKQFEVLRKLNNIMGKRAAHRVWRIYTFPSRFKHKLQILGVQGTIKFALKKIKDKNI